MEYFNGIYLNTFQPSIVLELYDKIESEGLAKINTHQSIDREGAENCNMLRLYFNPMLNMVYLSKYAGEEIFSNPDCICLIGGVKAFLFEVEKKNKKGLLVEGESDNDYVTLVLKHELAKQIGDAISVNKLGIVSVTADKWRDSFIFWNVMGYTLDKIDELKRDIIHCLQVKNFLNVSSQDPIFDLITDTEYNRKEIVYLGKKYTEGDKVRIGQHKTGYRLQDSSIEAAIFIHDGTPVVQFLDGDFKSLKNEIHPLSVWQSVSKI